MEKGDTEQLVVIKEWCMNVYPFYAINYQMEGHVMVRYFMGCFYGSTLNLYSKFW